MSAQTEVARLIGVLIAPDNELEAAIEGDRAIVDWFPPNVAIVRVTREGCSCALLKGLGRDAGAASTDAHTAGPGYAFRRGIAAAAVAFGGVHLMVLSKKCAFPHPPRVTNLGQFLRFGLMPDDELIAIAP